MSDTPWSGDVVGLVEAFRAGERSPREELEATLAAIEASDLNRAMDESRFTFVVVVPPRFESDIRRGRQPELHPDRPGHSGPGFPS